MLGLGYGSTVIGVLGVLSPSEFAVDNEGDGGNGGNADDEHDGGDGGKTVPPGLEKLAVPPGVLTHIEDDM